MNITSITVRREAKINTGNYENTTVSVELTASVGDGETYAEVATRLVEACDILIRNKVDDIELGKRKAESKAKRFGV